MQVAFLSILVPFSSLFSGKKNINRMMTIPHGFSLSELIIDKYLLHT
jgi:hypothetical protein